MSVFFDKKEKKLLKNSVRSFLLILVALIGSVSFVFGQDCDSLVVDEAGVFKGGLSLVEDAAQKLVNSGADVRIRTITTFGSIGNLDRYENRLENSCSSWQDGNGVRKNNLLVIIVSVRDHKTGLYYGSQWNNALGGGWQRIQTDHMNPQFKKGDFAGGFTAGINEVNRMINLYLHPEPVQQVSPSVVIVQSQSQPSGPVDLSGLWHVMGWLVGLCALAGLGFLFWQLKLKSEKRRAAQQKAVLRKQAASSRVNQLNDSLRETEINIAGLKNLVSGEDLKIALSAMEKTRKLIDSGTLKYSDVDKSAGDPSRPKLSEAEYAAIEQSYDGVIKTLDEAQESCRKSEEFFKNLQQMIDEVPSQIEEARSLLTKASQDLKKAEISGFKVDSLSDLVVKSERLLDGAEKFFQKKSYTAASGQITASEDLSLQISVMANNLSKRKEYLGRELSGLNSRVDKVRKDITNGKAIFDRISDVYAASSWKSVKGNGTEAVNRINQSVPALSEAASAISMENQEWEKAENIFKEVNGRLDQAESLMRSIVAIEQSLKVAHDDAPKEIEAAGDDINSARKYIHEYDDDIRDSLEDDLKEAQKNLTYAVQEMKNSKPDYFEVVKHAKLANESADKILAEARSEHEAAERLRHKAASALKSAKSRVSKAKEYIEDHSGDVDSDAKNKLKEAKRLLKEAESGSDLNMIVILAGQADDFGKNAYKLAEDDVSSAYVASSSSSYSSSDSGGSSSWGSSFDSDGGGSSSFDFGGGAGGGGSSSW